MVAMRPGLLRLSYNLNGFSTLVFLGRMLSHTQTVPYTCSLPIFAQVCFSENLYHVNGFKIFGLELPNCCLMAKRRGGYQLWEIDTMRMVFNVLNLKCLSDL